MFNLKITERTHYLLKQYISPGDVVVDATLGAGNDALFLHACVSERGVVFGLDIQQEALDISRGLFEEEGYGEALEDGSVKLIKLSHDRIDELFDIKDGMIKNNDVKDGMIKNDDIINGASSETIDIIIPINKKPSVIMFNLGYFPKGDKAITTKVAVTLKALEKSVEIIKSGGVLSIVTYPGHEEGGKEHREVVKWLSKLKSKEYEVLSLYQTNRSDKTPVQHLVLKK